LMLQAPQQLRPALARLHTIRIGPFVIRLR
jgi:hypothetical protein